MFTLFLMGYKGFEVLKSLSASDLKLVNQVVAARDSKIDNDYFIEIQEYCSRNDVRFAYRKEFDGVFSTYSLAIGWRWLIDHTKTQLFIIHDSLLPKYRGFNPLVSALINGDQMIGATLLAGGAAYDRGEIVFQASHAVEYPIKIINAIEIVAKIYIELVTRLFQKLTLRLEIPKMIQIESEATYSIWRDDNDYWIDWTRDSGYIARFCDAVGNPYKGARAELRSGLIVKIEVAEVFPDVRIFDRSQNIGKVIFVHDGKPVVICGSGLLKILEAKNQSNEPVHFKEFRNRFISRHHLSM